MRCVFIWSCKREFFHASKCLIAFKVFSIYPGLSLPWKSLALYFPISLSLSAASCPTAACEVTDEREIVRTEREREGGGIRQRSWQSDKGKENKGGKQQKTQMWRKRGRKETYWNPDERGKPEKKKRLEKDKNRKVKTKRGRRCEKKEGAKNQSR